MAYSKDILITFRYTKILTELNHFENTRVVVQK